MQNSATMLSDRDHTTAAFYRRTIRALLDAGVPFMIGGAFALRYHAGISRDTKDIDIFLKPSHIDDALAALGSVGYHTEFTFPHWLAKAYSGEDFVDLIFRSGNGISEVDDGWFEHAAEVELFGIQVPLCPPEESLWSKAFIMERERFDGADIAHLIRGTAGSLDWQRVLERFGPHWRVLFSHLILFGFIYPSERARVPDWVIETLVEQLVAERANDETPPRLCRGTLLSRSQYLIDIDCWGYQDARVMPHGVMTTVDTEHWTAAAER